MKLNSIFKTMTLAGLLATSVACQNSGSSEKTSDSKAETSTSASIEIPELLGRSGNVGNLQEVNKMSETYDRIKLQIERNPQDYQSRLKMADLYIVEARATGNYGYYYPAALQMIDGVLEENPSSKDDQFRALTSKAVILLSYHKFEEAKEMGEKALAVNPYNSRVYGILTDANVELGNYEKAVEMADSMNAIRPDLRSYSRVSYLREIYGDHEGAAKAMELAIQAGYPGHEETSWSRTTLGNLYEEYGQLDKAKEQYDLALASRENYPFATAGLASVAWKKGDLKQAEKLYKKAIDTREEAAFYEDLALLYADMEGKEAERKKARDQAFALLKGLAGEHGHSHGGHSHDGDKEHSHENDHGHSHEVGLEMAQLYMKLDGNYDEALHHALHEYAERPDNIEVNQALAEIYLMQGKLKQAEEHYLKATATNSKNPRLMLIGGMIQKKGGDAQLGKEMMAKAMKTNPHIKGELAKKAQA